MSYQKLVMSVKIGALSKKLSWFEKGKNTHHVKTDTFFATLGTSNVRFDLILSFVFHPSRTVVDERISAGK